MPDAAHLDAALSPEARAAALLPLLTQGEKLAQLGSVMASSLWRPGGLLPEKMRALLGQGIGQVARVAGVAPQTPREAASLANELQAFLTTNTRLGIPALLHDECLAGTCTAGATQYPVALGLAASWDAALVGRVAAAIGDEVAASGQHQGLAPVLDLCRDPRWGRVEETLGEDPCLVSALGVAYVRGLQGDPAAPRLLATGKHFVAYGASEGGLNWAPSHVPARELLDVYARPFEAAIRLAGLQSVMNAYQDIDGLPAGISSEILRELLRGQLGFTGLTVSDYFTLGTALRYHKVGADMAEVAAMGLEAGLDMDLPRVEAYGEALKEALTRGLVSESRLDESVGRVLTAKFRLGLFERPFVDTGAALDLAFENRDALAQRAAERSLVLLHNPQGLLPLKLGGRVALIGPHAHSRRLLLGDYSAVSLLEGALGVMRSGNFGEYQVESDSEEAAQIAALYGPYTNAPNPDELTQRMTPLPTLLEALRAHGGLAVEYARGCGVNDGDTSGFDEAAALARRSDVAVLVLGEHSGMNPPATTGESLDRQTLGLPGVQQRLLEAVAATGTPTVLVLISGRPHTLGSALPHAGAILHAFVPGQAGGPALVRALLGEVSPGGKLPISFPKSVGQIPVYASHLPSGGRSHWQGRSLEDDALPLFPFGHGLSYTTFAFGGLEAGQEGETLHVSCTLSNTGTRTGDEVAQLYLGLPNRRRARPARELAGFARATLEPGQTVRVRFTVPLAQLVSPAAGGGWQTGWELRPGPLDVWVGSSSQDTPLHARLTLDHAPLHQPHRTHFYAGVQVEEAPA